MWQEYKDRVITNIYGALILKEGNKFEFTYVPQLDKFTKKEGKGGPPPSRFQPVESVGFIIFIFQHLMYALVLVTLWKVLRATSSGFIPAV